MEFVCFTFIVDDIVLPDGQTVMEQLGGGGPQSLFGYQVVSGMRAKVGISAGVGRDVPASCRRCLSLFSIDDSGLIEDAGPRTPRAWQIFEADGLRTQVWRGFRDNDPKLTEMLSPKFEDLPPVYRQATNFHLGVHPSVTPSTLLEVLRQSAHRAGGLFTIEPYTSAPTPPPPYHLTSLLSKCDVFSPNELELRSLFLSSESIKTAQVPQDTSRDGMLFPFRPENSKGENENEKENANKGARGHPLTVQLALQLLALSPPGGANTVVVRCGADGVVLVARDPSMAKAANEGPDFNSTAFVCHVPAVQSTDVRDVTGCGNAFCGGFVSALHRHRMHKKCRTFSPNADIGSESPLDLGLSSRESILEFESFVESVWIQRIRNAASHSHSPSRASPPVKAGQCFEFFTFCAALADAAVQGCTAASFMAEVQGYPSWEKLAEQRRRRRRKGGEGAGPEELKELDVEAEGRHLQIEAARRFENLRLSISARFAPLPLSSLPSYPSSLPSPTTKAKATPSVSEGDKASKHLSDISTSSMTRGRNSFSGAKAASTLPGLSPRLGEASNRTPVLWVPRRGGRVGGGRIGSGRIGSGRGFAPRAAVVMGA